MRTLHLAGLATIVALGACTAQSAPPITAGSKPADAAAETIAISVGPCFGFCPVYDTTIAPDGTVRFEGKRHTVVVGARQRSAGRATYDAIAADLRRFRPQDGTSAQVECTAAITDTSGYTITWTDAAGRTTTATHQRGCRGGPGQALDGILATLPMKLGIEDWARQITRPGESRG